MCICPHPTWQSSRCEEVRQIIAKWWWAKLVVSYLKILEAVKVLQLSNKLRVWILMQCTYFTVIFNTFTKLWKFCFALSVWCMECRLMWGKKSNLKQFNIRQQHNKMWKKWRGMNTFARHCISSISQEQRQQYHTSADCPEYLEFKCDLNNRQQFSK